MSKTQKISVTNFKAISEMEIDFKGCTAIITAGNNKGKSSLLRGITDRIRGEKPELIVKQGEKEGKGTLELTTGEKFVWEFDVKGTDKLTFITKEGYKTKVTKEIVQRFFPVSFDIDKFLNSAPKEQSKQLQKIVGIDFLEIDNRYSLAYNDRTEKNKEAERYQVKLTSMLECTKVESVDLTELQGQKETERTRLNTVYLANKKVNDELRKKWHDDKEILRKEVDSFNDIQTKRKEKREKAVRLLEELTLLGYKDSNIDTGLTNWIRCLPIPELYKIFDAMIPSEPDYIDEKPTDEALQLIDSKILTASEINTKAKQYNDYIAYKISVEAAKVEAADADIKVKGIEEERDNLIKSAKMPSGISFGITGIEVDGYPLDKNQISTSKLYCAALRIASMNLGEVRTIHFDASFLDKNTLTEIEVWAEENNLQLLIERVDFDNGNIKYELIENN